ncbi:hypothetical protein J2T38_002312 [Neisseria perflava]|uniref:hypothetical protein n=1 Tax=Neisseria perflava TaxID=33053 RepID=UPI00209D3887|nr:hypothetical protein [Neisseria perflava]MCP1773458.1 hypothetical protein [Neisseria perflava]
MVTQADYMDSLKGRLKLVSDYALAQRWQVEPTQISQYRRGRLRLPIEFVLDIAEQTNTDPISIIRQLELERTKRKRGDVIERITWKPNEKVRRYVPEWVRKRNHFNQY